MPRLALLLKGRYRSPTIPDFVIFAIFGKLAGVVEYADQTEILA